MLYVLRVIFVHQTEVRFQIWSWRWINGFKIPNPQCMNYSRNKNEANPTTFGTSLKTFWLDRHRQKMKLFHRFWLRPYRSSSYLKVCPKPRSEDGLVLKIMTLRRDSVILLSKRWDFTVFMSHYNNTANRKRPKGARKFWGFAFSLLRISFF